MDIAVGFGEKAPALDSSLIPKIYILYENQRNDGNNTINHKMIGWFINEEHALKTKMILDLENDTKRSNPKWYTVEKIYSDLESWSAKVSYQWHLLPTPTESTEST